MQAYKLVQNTVSTYPRVKTSTYDTNAVSALLREHGVTEIHNVRRVERVPPESIFARGPRYIEHSELCFAMPSREEFARSPKGQASPAGSKSAERAIEEDLRKLIGPQPGITLTNWALGAEHVYNHCQTINTYLDVSLEDYGIEVTTRENGDMDRDEPGSEDVAEASKFAAAIADKFPNLDVAIDPCDEWVSVSIAFDDINADSLSPEKSEPTKSPRP